MGRAVRGIEILGQCWRRKVGLAAIGVLLVLVGNQPLIGDPIARFPQEDSRSGLVSNVDGVVRDAQDSSPVPGAKLQVTALMTTGLSRSGQAISETSDADGHFTLQRLSLGQYFLKASAPGFTTMRMSLAVNGADTAPISVLLSPECLIEGGVLDESGKGLAGMRVNAWIRVVKRGHVTFQLMASAVSEPSGRFKLTGLKSGDYMVQALRETDPNNPSVQRCAVCGFYPRTTVFGAAVISVEPSLTSTVRIISSPNAMYSVKGRVVDFAGKGTAGFVVRLVPCIDSVCIDGMTPDAPLDRSGRFLFVNVPNGSYNLELVAKDHRSGTVVSSHFLDVDFSDVDGEVIPSPSPASIIGQLAIPESQIQNGQAGSVRVMLVSSEGSASTQTASVSGDGSFSFQGVPSGKYFVQVHRPSDDYVEEMSFNSQRLRSDEIQVQTGANRLDITLSSGAGSISATVQKGGESEDTASQAPPHAIGVLYRLENGIPDVSSFKIIPAIDGQIVAAKLRPGGYLLFAVDNCSQDLWTFGEFVRAAAGLGTEVVVQKQAQTQVRLKLIPDASVATLIKEQGVVLPSD